MDRKSSLFPISWLPCINETYYPITYRNNFQVTPAMVHRSIWALRFGCRTLSDKNGKKKFGIAQVESIFVNHPVASAENGNGLRNRLPEQL